MAEVLFFIAALGAIAGAVGVVALKDPFYAVLSLVCHLLALAALFLLLRAQFLAAAQVVVYAGAVMVLYVFVVSYVGGADEPLQSPGPTLRALAPVCAGLLLIELSIAILGSGLTALGEEGARFDPGFGSPERIGQLLLTKFLFAFEAASYLLLVAAVGAVLLARRRRGLDERPEGPRPGDRGVLGRPPDRAGPVPTGTLAEAAGAGAVTPSVPPRRKGGW